MILNSNHKAFLALLKAGLWEQDVRLSCFGKIDYNEIYKLAEEQSVLGLVAAGIEHTVDVSIPQGIVLRFVSQALQLEQRNSAMNYFINSIVKRFNDLEINSILLKGQGIAQCYERPLWRSSGDIDFLVSGEYYKKAIEFLKSYSSSVDVEYTHIQHVAMNINQWEVELHGSLRGGLWKKLDKTLDDIQEESLSRELTRSWLINNTQVCLLRVDEDVVYVFSHILQHFYQEGVGLRQICDWCRLLWTFKDEINHSLLDSRLKRAGIMTEWKVFASLAVEYLGMPSEAMSFYSSDSICSYKASRVLSFIIKCGNFGNKRDYSYYDKYPKLITKVISFTLHTKDCFFYFTIFPVDSFKVLWVLFKRGILALIKGQ